MLVAGVEWEAGAAIAAAVSAIAAAVAAWSSRASVERAHRPFVYGEPAIKSRPTEPDGGGGFLSSEPSHIAGRVHNDGTGVALDVRFRHEAVDGSWYGEPIPPARAMQPGEAIPPMDMNDARYELERPPDLGRPFELVTRYTDAAGRDWETRNQRHPPGPLRGPTRLRRGRLDLWRPRRDR